MGHLVPIIQHVLLTHSFNFFGVVYRQLIALHRQKNLGSVHESKTHPLQKFKTPHYTGKRGDRNTAWSMVKTCNTLLHLEAALHDTH